MENAKWYAVFVKTGDEDKVKERLEFKMERTLKFFVPKRRLKERKNGVWKETVRTLFPGYLLVEGTIDNRIQSTFREVPGLVKVIGSEGEPLEIERCEIEIISRLICNGEVIGISKGFIVNDRVKIADGPLKSMEGIILSIDKRKGRAKVRVNFMGEARNMDLGINLIE